MSFILEGPDLNSNLWVIIVPMLLAWALIIGSSGKIIISDRKIFSLNYLLPLLASAGLTLLIMAAFSGYVSEYWNPGEQNWKFEYNGIMLSRGESPAFAHSNPHGSSLLMAPFFLIFGETHSAVVILNGLALLAAALFASQAAGEAFGGKRLPTILAGPFLVAYFPVIALWGAGGEYALFLAAMSASMWLILRSMRDSSTASLLLTGAVIFLSALIRIEGFFMWLLWPPMLFIKGKLKLKRLAAMAAGAAFNLTLILIAIRHIVFGNAGKPILRFEHLPQNSGWLAFFLSDGAVVLLLMLPGLFVLARRNVTAALCLMCLSSGYGFFWLLGPSFDHCQISTQIILPLCIIASGAFLLLEGRNKFIMISAAALMLILHVMPLGNANSYLSPLIKSWQQSDLEMRKLSQELNADIPLMANLPHVKMTMPQVVPLADRYISIEEFNKFASQHKRMACFSTADHPSECAYTRELFQRKSAGSLLEPEKFGFTLESSRRNGSTFLNIYKRKQNN